MNPNIDNQARAPRRRANSRLRAHSGPSGSHAEDVGRGVEFDDDRDHGVPLRLAITMERAHRSFHEQRDDLAHPNLLEVLTSPVRREGCLR